MAAVSIEPRKAPSQERAEATVQALLDATAAELLEGGYDRMSTNKIAKRAGVSVGSLYQYFPNKEAIVAALRRRSADKERENVRAALADLDQADLPVVVRGAIKAVIASYLTEPELRKAYATEVPPIGGLTPHWENDRLVMQILLDWIERHPGRVKAHDFEMKLFIVLHAVDGAVRQALLQNPAFLETEPFVEELTKLVTGYLERL